MRAWGAVIAAGGLMASRQVPRHPRAEDESPFVGLRYSGVAASGTRNPTTPLCSIRLPTPTVPWESEAHRPGGHRTDPGGLFVSHTFFERNALKKIILAIAVAAVATMAFVGSASAGVARYQTQTATFTATTPYGRAAVAARLDTRLHGHAQPVNRQHVHGHRQGLPRQRRVLRQRDDQRHVHRQLGHLHGGYAAYLAS